MTIITSAINVTNIATITTTITNIFTNIHLPLHSDEVANAFTGELVGEVGQAPSSQSEDVIFPFSVIGTNNFKTQRNLVINVKCILFTKL